MHNFGGYNGNQIGSAGGPTQAQFAYVWGLIAAQFSGQIGLLGYDLMNEPHDMPAASVVPNMYQAAITAIRAIDTTSTIYIEGDAYASSFGWLGNCANCGGAPIGGWAVNGNDSLRLLTDPNHKLVFAAHSYADYNGSGTYPTYPNSIAIGCTAGQTSYQCAQTMGDQLTSPTSAINTNILVKRYTPFVSWCNTYGLKCWIGESGVSYDDTNWLTVLDNGISYLQNNNILFTYWGAGPEFACASSTNCSYNLGVEPTNGIDTPQMAVLSKYANAYSPKTYQISGPSQGTSGVLSSNFNVTYNGYIRKSFNIIFNDNNAGGVFSPSSITCNAGFNCSGNFTYTPPGSSIYTIGATNTGGLTDPSKLGFATVLDQFTANGITASNIINALSFVKIYAPYIGNDVLLRRGVDNATKAFGFTSSALGSVVDTAAIQAWNGTGETYTIGSSTIIVQYSSKFSSDGGVSYTSSGTPFVEAHGFCGFRQADQSPYPRVERKCNHQAPSIRAGLPRSVL